MTKFELSESAKLRRFERDQKSQYPQQKNHQNGTCAGIYGLCSACAIDEHAEMLAWAKQQDAPNPNEDFGDYWRRIGGSFLDSWANVAIEMICLQKEEHQDTH